MLVLVMYHSFQSPQLYSMMLASFQHSFIV